MAKGGAQAGNLQAQNRMTEVRQRLMFVLIAIIVYRIGSFIPLPGVDAVKLKALFDNADSAQGILGVFNAFTGGSLQRMSLFALGVMPYISASIITQLLSAVLPSWKELRKDGQAGQRTINGYTRQLTVLLATFQGLVTASTLVGYGVAVHTGAAFYFIVTISLVGGSLFLMWLGEQITERGIGNGISIIIFVGIVAGMPGAIDGLIEQSRTSSMGSMLILGLFSVAIGLIALICFAERGQRRITVNYAQRQQGRRVFQGQSSFLPFKMNMAGVIPPIFASSIILFPATILSFIGQGNDLKWLSEISASLSPGQPLYAVLYASMIIFFCFFYTALMYDSNETADNLKRSGAFVPGVRPGEQTARYIDTVLTRLTFWGALYITFVCLVPEILLAMTGGSSQAFYLGGTSLLIVVVVVMDFMAQLQAHLMSHQYDGLMKKANLRGNN